MFTHIVVGTNDPEASASFFDATFGALGIPGNRDMGENKFYGAYRRDPVGSKLCAFTINVGE